MPVKLKVKPAGLQNTDQDSNAYGVEKWAARKRQEERIEVNENDRVYHGCAG